MPEDFNPNIAHITVPGARDGDPPLAVFQVLNEASDDWDEAATRALYEAYLAGQAVDSTKG